MLLNRGPNAFGSPGTLPDGTEPLIFADFKNGVYTLDGASVAFGDLFQEDLAWGAYQPTMLVPGSGMTSTDDGIPNRFMLKPGIASLLADEATIVPGVSVLDGSRPQVRIFLTDSSLFNYYFVAGVEGGGAQAGGWDDGAVSDLLPFPYNESEVKVAFNLSRTRLAMSLNGGTVQADDATDPGPFSAIGVQVTGLETLFLESVGFYPLQDEAELPGLSALS